MKSQQRAATASREAAVRQVTDPLCADLLRVVQGHWRAESGAAGARLLSHTLVEFSGAVLAGVVATWPELSADVDRMLEHLRLHVSTAGHLSRH